MELCANNCLNNLNDYELQAINGGTFWGVVSGSGEVIAGAAGVVGGLVGATVTYGKSRTACCALATAGAATFCGGISTIASNT